MTTQDFKIRLSDPSTGRFEWAGLFSEFVTDNSFSEAEVGLILDDIQRHGRSLYGGGASPLVLIEAEKPAEAKP